MKKASLRKVYKEKRMQLSAESLALLSQSIGENFKQHIDLQAVQTLHSFLSIAQQKEVQTHYIWEWLAKEYPHITLIASRSNFKSKEMQHFAFKTTSSLELNPWGIPEPSLSSQEYPASALDIILVPLLIFDQNGHRVGYGSGFYDRFLAQCAESALKIGLSFFPPIAKITDVDQGDIPLDLVISPSSLYSFPRR